MFSSRLIRPPINSRGWGYYGYDFGILALYVFLLRDALLTIKTVTGGQRLELQVWLGGGCAMAATILALRAIYALSHDPFYVRLQPVVVLIFYAGTAYAITTFRIFDGRQILLVCLEKVVLVTAVAGAAFVLDRGLSEVLSRSLALLATTALALWFAAALNGWLDRVFQFYPQATAARQAAYTVARREIRAEELEQAFLSILKGWGQTDCAVILSGTKALEGAGIELEQDGATLQVMRQLRWATPERLAREKSAPEREELGRFLLEQRLGVVVLGEGPTLTRDGRRRRARLAPAVYLPAGDAVDGARLDHRERAGAQPLSVKAQHAEQLATVGLLGASLAHEIRNPLVTIKTFVQLLPQHHQDPAFRDKFFRLIGDEVSRIDRLTEQLLDLASPARLRARWSTSHPPCCAPASTWSRRRPTTGRSASSPISRPRPTSR